MKLLKSLSNLMFGTLLLFSVNARAENISYYDCTEIAGAAEQLQITLFPLLETKALFHMTKKNDPHFFQVFSAKTEYKDSQIFFTNAEMQLVINLPAVLPTLTFTAELLYQGSSHALVCELRSYDSPIVEPPGGVSVHN